MGAHEVTDPENDKFPRPFGHYLLLARIASGGMGSVYLARRDMGGIEKHCVVKTLRPHYTDDREYVARFIDEARVVVQLTHRNICPVFDVGKVGGRHYLAMEYVSGPDLKSFVERAQAAKRPLTLAVTLHLLIEVLDALDYAHRHEDPRTGKAMHLVHRDVSPQNVMINFEGEVKLIDFGLAASNLKAESTNPNVVMGKLAYMAPEHARGDPVDGRSDQFSAAVMGWELFSGKRFYGVRPGHEIWSVAGVGGFRPNDFNVVDPELAAILDRALQGDREARYPNCGEMKEALEGVRYARGLRGGKEALRALANELFSDSREESRRMLTSLASVGRGELARPSAERTEPTVTIAVAPSVNPDITIVSDASALAAPRRARVAVRAAALLGLFAATSVTAFLLLRPSPAAPADPVPPPPPVVAVPPRPPPPVTAPIVDAGPATAEVALASPPDAGPPPKSPVAEPRRPRTPKKPPPPGVDATDAQRLGYLDKVCPKIACRAKARELDATWRKSKEKTDIAAFKRALQACVDTCAK